MKWCVINSLQLNVDLKYIKLSRDLCQRELCTLLASPCELWPLWGSGPAPYSWELSKNPNWLLNVLRSSKTGSTELKRLQTIQTVWVWFCVQGDPGEFGFIGPPGVDGAAVSSSDLQAQGFDLRLSLSVLFQPLGRKRRPRASRSPRTGECSAEMFLSGQRSRGNREPSRGNREPFRDRVTFCCWTDQKTLLVFLLDHL